MLRVYAQIVWGILAVVSAVAYSVAERWTAYAVIVAVILAVTGIVIAVRVQRDLDAHLRATREAVKDVRATTREIRRTIDEG